MAKFARLCRGRHARPPGRGRFASRETDFVADLAAHLAQGLRTALLAATAEGGHGAPGAYIHA